MQKFTLICLHGAGMTADFWQPQRDGLAADFELFTPQIPGMLIGNLHPSMADYADFIHQQIQLKNITNPVLIGHSMGGGIVLQLLLRYPSFYANALLSNTGARLKVLPALLLMLTQYPNDWKQQITGSVKDLTKGQLLGLAQAVSRDPLAPLLQFQACNQFDVMDQLNKINADVQVVVADQDLNTPAKYGEYLAQHIPDAQLHRLPGGHLSPFVGARAFNQIIRDWLQSA